MKHPTLNRLERTFSHLRDKKRKALVIYLMAGDPDIAFTERIVPRLSEAGVDAVELGLPFSDPIADGPVIQAAATRALHRFNGVSDFLAMVARIRKATDLPIATMTYYNPIFRYGEAAFAKDAAAAGLDGVIIPDIPVDEAGDWPELCRAAGLSPILLEAPNTDDAHARAIAERAGGFIYMVSLKGVTGTDVGMGDNLAERVKRFRAHTQTPLIVGFGISTPAQAAQVGAISDGVVIGSSVVSRIAGAPSAAAAEKTVLEYVKTLRVGLDSIQ